MLWSRGILPVLLLIFAVWGAVFYTSIASTVAIWYRSETFAHGFIILPICIYLLKLKWAQLERTPIRPAYPVILLIVPLLATWLLGTMANLLVVEQAATFMLLPLMIWAVCGHQVARVLLFPMLFWLFSVPAGEFMVPQLQELTADITVWALQLSGIPVFREGLYIAIPGGLFEVAVACSGIRYLIASFTIGSLYAYLNYQTTRKRLIFILFSIVLPLIANGVRAYGIVLIAYLSDMKYATGVDHLVYGWVFFGLVILLMFAVGNRWAEPPPQTDVKDKPSHSADYATLLPSALLLAGLVAAMHFYRAVNVNVSVQGNFEIQRILPALEYTLDPALEQSWQPSFVNPTETFSGRTKGVDVYVAYYQGNEQKKELINEVNRPFNAHAWSYVSSEKFGRYEVIEITNARGMRRLVSYGYATHWIVSSNALRVKLSQVAQALLGEAQTGMALVLSLNFEDGHRDAAMESIKGLSEQTFNDSLKEALPRD